MRTAARWQYFPGDEFEGLTLARAVRERERQSEGEIQRETERDRDRVTESEINRETAVYIASGRGTQMVHRSARTEAAAGWVLTLMCGL